MTKTTKAVAMLGMVAALGVAALPLSSYAATGVSTASEDATIKVNVTESISITLDKSELNLGNVDSTKTVSGDITATVKTNATNYNLKLAAKTAADVNMHRTTDSVTIPAVTETPTDLTAGTSAYGYKVESTYAALSDSGVIIKSGSATTGEETKVTFGVAVDAGVAPGEYSSQVTFTAATGTGV